ncbi:MAG: ribonuclease P protein component [Cyanobacteriota bacterium]|nr:ribonuclease P protein component [Cyanobacteriota bacterium]
MLSARYRLRRRSTFDQIYKQGKRQSCPLFSLSWIPMTGSSAASPPQIAVVVSKKVCRHAVGRNRVKRRLRAAIRHLLPQVPTGYWLVLTARTPVLTSDWSTILRQLQELLQKIPLPPHPEGASKRFGANPQAGFCKTEKDIKISK